MQHIGFRHFFEASRIRISSLAMFSAISDFDEPLSPNRECGRADYDTGRANHCLPGLQCAAGVS
jgi:hypothetical protein